MTNRLTAMLTLLLSLGLYTSLSHAEIIKIGVLSEQSFRTSIKQWSSTANYLEQQLPQHVFQILPYSQSADVITDLKKNKLDLVLSQKTDLSGLITDFSLHSILNVQKRNTQWVLARNHNLPDTISYPVTKALLQLPASLEAKAGHYKWTPANNTEIQLSITQKLKQVYNQFTSLITGILNQYWTLLIAAFLSASLILLYRKWDRHHTRLTEINKHQQQPRDPSLSDTVF